MPIGRLCEVLSIVFSSADGHSWKVSRLELGSLSGGFMRGFGIGEDTDAIMLSVHCFQSLNSGDTPPPKCGGELNASCAPAGPGDSPPGGIMDSQRGFVLDEEVDLNDEIDCLRDGGSSCSYLLIVVSRE